MIYLYLEVIHLISIISWMVGLLYLPRLFVYHSECNPESITAEIFTIMEKRLMKIKDPAKWFRKTLLTFYSNLKSETNFLIKLLFPSSVYIELLQLLKTFLELFFPPL